MATIQSIFDISELNLMTKEELIGIADQIEAVSYTHLRAHET